MEMREILSHCDHTLLKQESTWEQIKEICDNGVKYGCASVCIPACYVKRADEYLEGKLKVCTVIGFPNGYSTAAVKAFEILEEIKAVKLACGGHILKVIVETCLLTEEEKIKMCEIVTESGADYIKTSTGFSTGGATREDVKLFAEHVGPGVKIKAAGGIASWKDAEDFIALGADRLGTSRLVKLAKGQQGTGY